MDAMQPDVSPDAQASIEDATAIVFKDSDGVVHENLLGLVGCVSEHLSEPTIRDAIKVLNDLDHSNAMHAAGHKDTVMDDADDANASVNDNDINGSSTSAMKGNEETETRPDHPEAMLVETTLRGARQFCTIPQDLSKKKTWLYLQDTAAKLCQTSPQGGALAACSLYASLSLLPFDYEPAKAVASAIASTVSRNEPVRQGGMDLANHFLSAFLGHASYSDSINLHIVTYFAKAFKIADRHHAHPDLSAKAIRHALRMEDADITSSSDGELFAAPETTTSTEDEKHRVSSSLALACQVRPWPDVPPVKLIEAAVIYDLWHAAEQLCVQSHRFATAKQAKRSKADTAGTLIPDLHQSTLAVETLVDFAMESRMYRRADTLATNLYDMGGKSRYVNARLYHAYDTVAKVILKRQSALIERQVDRVDKAVNKINGVSKKTTADVDINNDAIGNDNAGTDTGTNVDSIQMPMDTNDANVTNPRDDIRQFALQRLEEAGEIDAAHRLAGVWNLEYIYDEQTMLKAAEARRQRYVQWDEVLPGTPVPKLITDANDLREAWKTFRSPPFECGPFGFDAEWEEDTTGAALLQFGHCKTVLLVDLPALSSTQDGALALRETIGETFACPRSVVVGFVCRQDMSRLRGSPCCLPDNQHWMPSPVVTAGTVVDAQRFVAKDEPKLAKFGLSRVVDHYFGKPLDKSEQCSLWSARPLSERQRTYAALDAWVCAALHQKVFPTWQPRDVNGAGV